jgi:acyl-CoA thioester hydrolase
MNTVKKFSLKVTVLDDDIDLLGHANNVVYLRWAQDVAEAHWKNIASESVQKEMIWVVIRHEIDYKKQALAGESLTLYTWVVHSEGVRSTRHVEICNTKDEIVAAVKTTWCLVDPDTRKPKRIPEEIKKLFIPDI